MKQMDWLEYVRSEKKKPFDKVQISCPFPADVIFQNGYDVNQMFEMTAIDPIDETIPHFSSDPETIVKQIVGYAILLNRIKVYKNELDKNYGILAASLAGLLEKASFKTPSDLFECNKLVRQIREYATSIASRERREEELMDSQRIEAEIKGLEDFPDDGNADQQRTSN